MTYNYIQRNDFTNIQRYSFSDFEGVSFLSDYDYSRNQYIDKYLQIVKKDAKSMLVLEKFKKDFNNFDFGTKNLVKTLFSSESNFSNSALKIKGKQLNVEKTLIQILLSLTKEVPHDLISVMDLFIKKYEVFRRIYPTYIDLNPPDKIKRLGDYTRATNYLLLSLCCLTIYKLTNNLKYINTALKINDLLCCISEVFSKQKDYLIFIANLKIELSLTGDLIKNYLNE